MLATIYHAKNILDILEDSIKNNKGNYYDIISTNFGQFFPRSMFHHTYNRNVAKKFG